MKFPLSRITFLLACALPLGADDEPSLYHDSQNSTVVPQEEDQLPHQHQHDALHMQQQQQEYYNAVESSPGESDMEPVRTTQPQHDEEPLENEESVENDRIQPHDSSSETDVASLESNTEYNRHDERRHAHPNPPEDDPILQNSLDDSGPPKDKPPSETIDSESGVPVIEKDDAETPLLTTTTGIQNNVNSASCTEGEGGCVPQQDGTPETTGNRISPEIMEEEVGTIRDPQQEMVDPLEPSTSETVEGAVVSKKNNLLQQDGKEDESSKGSDGSEPKDGKEDPHDDEDGGKMSRVTVDYANKSSGALILEKSPTMKGSSNLLNDDMDRYAIAPCEDKKYVVVGLSEDILVKQVFLANYERYSSHVKEFTIFGSTTMGDWADLGTFTAKPRNGEQSFDLTEPVWARYLKFRFTTHYGSEHYCTLSQIKVHGSTMLQGFHEQWQASEEETEGDPDNDSTSVEKGSIHSIDSFNVDSEPSDHVEGGSERGANNHAPTLIESVGGGVSEITAKDGSLHEKEGNNKELLVGEVEANTVEVGAIPTESSSGVSQQDSAAAKQTYSDESTTQPQDGHTDTSLSQSSIDPIDPEGLEPREEEMTDEQVGVVGLNYENKEVDLLQGTAESASVDVLDTMEIPKESFDNSEVSLDGSPSADDHRDHESKNNGSAPNDRVSSYVEDDSVTKESASNDLESSSRIPILSQDAELVEAERDTNASNNKAPDAASSSSYSKMTDTVIAVVAEASGAIKSSTVSSAVEELKKIIRTNIGSNRSSDEDSLNNSDDTDGDDKSALLDDAKPALGNGETHSQDSNADSGHRPIRAVDATAMKESTDVSKKFETQQDAATHGQQLTATTGDSHDSTMTKKRNTKEQEEKKSGVVESTSVEEKMEKTYKNVEREDELLASILSRRIPGAECIKALSFSEFKAKTVAARNAGQKAPGTPAANAGTNGQDRRMEPIFKTLTDQLKTLQGNQAVTDQYLKAVHGCYEKVILNIAMELESVETVQAQRLANLEAAFLDLSNQTSLPHTIWYQLKSLMISLCSVSKAILVTLTLALAANLTMRRVLEEGMGANESVIIAVSRCMVLMGFSIVVGYLWRWLRSSDRSEKDLTSAVNVDISDARNEGDVKGTWKTMHVDNSTNSDTAHSSDHPKHVIPAVAITTESEYEKEEPSLNDDEDMLSVNSSRGIPKVIPIPHITESRTQH